jgi:hypothetical protein
MPTTTMTPKIVAQVRSALFDMKVYKKQRPPPPVRAEVLFPDSLDTIPDIDVTPPQPRKTMVAD